MKRDRVAAGASTLLGIGIAANALLGPLVLGVIRIRESANMENQLLGGELTSLFLAAPLAIVGGLLWWRGNPRNVRGPWFGLYPRVDRHHRRILRGISHGGVHRA